MFFLFQGGIFIERHIYTITCYWKEKSLKPNTKKIHTTWTLSLKLRVICLYIIYSYNNSRVQLVLLEFFFIMSGQTFKIERFLHILIKSLNNFKMVWFETNCFWRPLKERFRALFTLKNIGGEHAITWISKEHSFRCYTNNEHVITYKVTST